jgi:hypothetical protein
VNGRSQVGAANDVSSQRRRETAVRQASKREVEDNQWSLTEGSRHWGKAARPNERRQHLDKFELQPVVYRQVRCQLNKKKKLPKTLERGRVAAVGCGRCAKPVELRIGSSEMTVANQRR